MRLARTVPLFLGLLTVGLLAPPLLRAEPPAPAELRKTHKQAFRSLGVPSAKRLEKTLPGKLPGGVVIEAAPFDRLISQLLAPHAAQLDLRDRVLADLAAHPGPVSGKLVASSLATVAKEASQWAKRLAAVEEAYGEVYNRGYMEASEGARRTRKTAAVLIPFYRTLTARGRALADGAVVALAAMKEGEALTWLVGTARTHADPAVRSVAVAALGRIGGDGPHAALVTSAAKDPAAAVRGRALEALTAWPLSRMKDAVLAAIRDASWEVRALAVAMCVRGKLLEAVPALIDALEREPGRLRTDIDDALHALVGVRMYADAARWKRWWKENRAEIEAKTAAQTSSGALDEPLGPIEDWPTPGDDEAEDAEQRGGTSTFYGIQTRSKRIVFVIDISRSMDSEAEAKPPQMGDARHPYAKARGRSKLDIARWQLHRAVHDLPDDAVFNVIVYSESYALWQTGMAEAKKRAKKKAHAFIDGLTANGTTNICDSLDKALEIAGLSPLTGGAEETQLAADTIFLLSDGDPNRGRLSSLPALLEDLVDRNRRARIVVHTIGIGEAAGSSFLKDLARRTGGRYVGFR
jgi:hypothetical protein